MKFRCKLNDNNAEASRGMGVDNIDEYIMKANNLQEALKACALLKIITYYFMQNDFDEFKHLRMDKNNVASDVINTCSDAVRALKSEVDYDEYDDDVQECIQHIEDVLSDDNSEHQLDVWNEEGIDGGWPFYCNITDENGHILWDCGFDCDDSKVKDWDEEEADDVSWY